MCILSRKRFNSGVYIGWVNMYGRYWPTLRPSIPPEKMWSVRLVVSKRTRGVLILLQPKKVTSIVFFSVSILLLHFDRSKFSKDLGLVYNLNEFCVIDFFWWCCRKLSFVEGIFTVAYCVLKCDNDHEDLSVVLRRLYC